jgi:hypothetical protein
VWRRQQHQQLSELVQAVAQAAINDSHAAIDDIQATLSSLCVVLTHREPCAFADKRFCFSADLNYPTSFATPPFDLDGNTAVFSTAELQAIVKIWANVAEVCWCV